MNFFKKLAFILVTILQLYQATIIAKGVQTDYKDAVCIKVGVDNRQRSNYRLTDLVDGGLSYQSIGIALWYKFQSNPYYQNTIVGISSDLTDNLLYNRMVLGYAILSQSSQDIVKFYSTNGYRVATSKFSSITSNVWRRIILVYPIGSQKAQLSDSDVNGSSAINLSLQFSQPYSYWLNFYQDTANYNQNVWLNLDHGIESNDYSNSCSRQKNAMFFYSNDEVFGIDRIQNIYSDYFQKRIYKPIYYFPLQRKKNNLITDQTVSFLKFKNIYMPNLNDALNGGGLTNQQYWVSMTEENDAFIPILVPGKYIYLNYVNSIFQILFSFIFEYQTISVEQQFLRTNNILLSTSSSSGKYILKVTYQGITFNWDLVPSGSRITLVFKYSSTSQNMRITYFIDSQINNSGNVNGSLPPQTFLQLGTSNNSSNAYNVFIKDLFIIPNADAKINSQFPSDETQYQLQNCDLFAQYGFNSSICLICSSQYVFQYDGTCEPKTSQSQGQLITSSKLFFGSKLISMVEASTNPKSIALTYNYQISDINFNLLILGRYYINSVPSGYMVPLAYLQADDPHQYYFLHLYLQDRYTVVLKMTLDVANLICKTSVTYFQPITSQWMTFGFGYNNVTASAYLIYQDIYSNLILSYTVLSCQNTPIDTSTLSFTICLGCLLPNQNTYSQMSGSISQVRLLEGFDDYNNISDYIYYYNLVMEQSASNIIYQNIISLKDIFTYSFPQIQFSCKDGYAFFEGFCIVSSSCQTIVRSQNILGTYNALYYDNIQKSCENCPSNCSGCSSFSVCTTCRVGYILDPQGSDQCIPCPIDTLYDSTSQSCVPICPVFTDLNNKMCQPSFNLYEYQSSPLLSVQWLSENDGFQILQLNGQIQPDSYVKCSNDVPYQSFIFYGGQQVLANQLVTKRWSQLPNNYKKTVSFYMVLYGSSSINDVKVTMNNNLVSNSVFNIINTDTNICNSNSNNQSITLAYAKYVYLDNSNTLNLSLSFSKNGFAIRNVQLSVSKCHSTCFSCQSGPDPWNCITCQSIYEIYVNKQCICQENEYYQSQGCYSSPCYDCLECTQPNCLRCEDETGLCVICNSGYFLYQGTCILSCSLQQNQAIYSPSSVCYQTLKPAFDQLKKNLVISDLEFWGQYPNTIVNNRYTLLNCLNQQLLPNQGIINGIAGYFFFQMYLSDFQPKYQGFKFNFQLAIIDSMSMNQDYIIFYQNGQNIQVATYGMDSTGSNSCSNPSYYDKFVQRQFQLFQNTGYINLVIQSQFTDTITVKSFSIGEVQGYYILNSPLCTSYQYYSLTSIPTCASCDDKSVLNIQNQCVCKNGYYFYYNTNANEGECRKCNSACSLCTGPTVYSCSKCNSGYVQYQQTCLETCFEGTYPNAQNNCVSCDPSCFGCRGPSNNQCTSCQVGMFLFNNQCYSNCQQTNSSLVPNNWLRVCEKSREQQGELLFSTNMYFVPSTFSFYKISTTQGESYTYLCQDTPMLGIFPGIMSFGIQQIQAHSVLKLSLQIYFNTVCQYCQITASIQQLQISSSQTVNIPLKSCSNTSVQSYTYYFNDIQTNLQDYTFIIEIPYIDFSVSNIQLNTLACHPTCRFCLGTEVDQCTSCFEGSEILGNSPIGQCVCSDPRAALGLTTHNCSNSQGCMKCLSCKQPCSSCFRNDIQSCSTCIQGYSLYISSCVTACPVDISVAQLDNNQNQICTPCIPPCARCNQNFQCLSCISGFLYVPDQKQCYSVCPKGYFKLSSDQSNCYTCNSSCGTCINTNNNCVTCADGFYLYQDNILGNQCIECNENCQTCTGPSNSNCISCQQTLGIVSFSPNNTITYCTSTCEEVPGYFLSQDDEGNFSCQNCAANCSGCTSTSPDTCTSCNKGYALLQGTCSSCDASCYTCSGATTRDCTSCISPLTLADSSCLYGCPIGQYILTQVIQKITFNQCVNCPNECSSCVSKNICMGCKIGNYIDNNKCLKCKSDCNNCYGQNGSLCLDCSQGYFLQGQICVKICEIVGDIGYYGDLISRKCLQCNKVCRSCSNSSSSSCTSCYPRTYLIYNQCKDCPSSSLTCIYNENTYVIDSLSCAPGFYLFQKKCLVDCPKGFFADSSINTCVYCNIGCKQCLDSSLNQCQQCTNSYLFIPPSSCKPCTDFLDSCISCISTTLCTSCEQGKILYHAKCVSQCDSTLGLYQENFQCKSCNAPCAECTSATSCTKCIDGFYLNGNKCSKCDIMCTTCDGGSSSNCTSCSGDFFLQQTMQGKNVCSKNCLYGFYADSNLCMQCNYSCGECTSASVCITCNSGYYRVSGQRLCKKCKDTCSQCTDIDTCQQCANNAFLMNNDCISTCPDGFYGLNGTCFPCHLSCQNCANSSKQCTSCSIGYYLSNEVCLACNSVCIECISSTQCTKCQPGTFLENDECKSKCDTPQTYPDIIQSKCLKCDTSCNSCNGPSSKNCLNCFDGYYFSPLDHVLNGYCIPCDSSCTKCTGPQNNECSTCQPGTQFIPPNTCVKCPLNSYFDGVKCSYCSNSCKTCFGPSSYNCLSCPDSYFLNTDTNICTSCARNCQICIGDRYCVECQQGYFLYENSDCVKICPPGMRGDINSRMCLCDVTCHSCSYNSQTNLTSCLKCANSDYLLNGNNSACILFSECTTYKDMINMSCVASCPKNTLNIDFDEKICSNNPCKTTQHLQVLNNQQYCVSSCKGNSYLSIETNECLSCNNKCNSCTGSKDSECTSCTGQNYYHPEISTCRDSCLTGFIQSDITLNVCTICKTNCNFCIDTLYMHQGNCVTSCPVGYTVVGQACEYIPTSRVQIANVTNNQTISINNDFEIKAELFSPSKIQDIIWDITESLDKSFISDFSEISSNSLTQVIPFLILKASNSFTISITVILKDGTSISDERRIQTSTMIRDGQFNVDKVSGDSFLTSFIFQITDWNCNEQLYFDLNFYELQGIQQFNLTMNASSTQLDFLKNNLFLLYENETLNKTTTIVYKFQPFAQDINLICELKIYNQNKHIQQFKYLIIKLNKYSGNNQDFKMLKNLLNTISSTSDMKLVGQLLFSYTFTLNYMISKNSTHQTDLNKEIDLRQISKLLGISKMDLPSCNDNIDCFQHGICTNNFLFQEKCFCSFGYYGYNCEWNEKEYDIILNSFSIIKKLLTQITVTPIIKIQIIENLMIYFSVFYQSYNNSLNVFINLYTSILDTYLQGSIEADSGQILQRSLSTLISVIKQLKIDPSSLMNYTYTLQNKIASALNVGEKLITSSHDNDAITSPLLTRSVSKKRGQSNKSRFLEDSNPTPTISQVPGIPIMYGQISITFPPEVIISNQKQIIQISQWKKNPRDNPEAITQCVSVSLSSGGQITPVNNLNEPIILTLPKSIPSPISKDTSSIQCTYYDEASNSFKSEGCTFVKETILNIICSCTHLTDFTAQIIQSKLNTQATLSDLKNTIDIGNQELQKSTGSSVVITSLPILKIGQKSINLINQLNIMQSGGPISLIKQNMILLKENKLYKSTITEYLEQEHIILPFPENQQTDDVQQQNVDSILIIMIVYALILVFFFFIMRANLRFQFIKIKNNKIKLFECDFIHIFDDINQKKEKRVRKYLQRLPQLQPLNQRRSVSTLKKNNNEIISQQELSKVPIVITESQILDLNQQSYISQIKEIGNQNQLIQTQDSNDSNNILTNTIIKSSHNYHRQHDTKKKSLFSFTRVQSSEQDNNFDTKAVITTVSLDDLDQKKVSTINYIESTDELNTDSQKDTIIQIGTQPFDKLNTIISERDEEEDFSEIQSSSQIKRDSNKLLPEIEVISKEQREFDHNICVQKEKTTHPRVQSIANLKKVINLSLKLKHNSQLLNQNHSKSKESKSQILNQQQLREKKEFVKQTSQYLKQDEINGQQKSYINQQIEIMKRSQSFQFINSISKQEASLKKIEQLQQLKKLINEDLRKTKIPIHQIYTIDTFGRVLFNENNLEFSLDSLQKQQFKEILEKEDILIKKSNKKQEKRRENAIQSLQIQKHLIILQQIEHQIISKKKYIQLMENVIKSFLQINSLSIFQFYSLLANKEHFLSFPFTKCLYIYTQLLVAALVNMMFYSELPQILYIHSYLGIAEIQIFRIFVTFIFSYIIPYFFFGCVTNIFANQTMLLPSFEEIQFKLINKVRRTFLIVYILVGGIQILICFFGLFYYYEYTTLSYSLNLNSLIVEVLISQIIGGLILDGILFLIYVYYIEDDTESELGWLEKLLACRGCYYYKGYDNFNIYKQYHLAQLINDI